MDSQGVVARALVRLPRGAIVLTADAEATTTAAVNTPMWERLTPMGDGALRYRFAVEDPQTWTRPWTGEYVWVGTAERSFEYACHEGELRAAGDPARRSHGGAEQIVWPTSASVARRVVETAVSERPDGSRLPEEYEFTGRCRRRSDGGLGAHDRRRSPCDRS
jgi:hypothetical protein